MYARPFATVLILAARLPGAAHAQADPERSVRFLVGFAAGGATDIAARTFATISATVIT